MPGNDSVGSRHHHTTLKAPCVTRWNSALTMVESILDLRAEVQNILTGHLDLCLSELEFNLLSDLRQVLSPFKTFTDIVSGSTPTLSLVPVMRMKIRKLCLSNAQDDANIIAVKIMAVKQKFLIAWICVFLFQILFEFISCWTLVSNTLSHNRKVLIFWKKPFGLQYQDNLYIMTYICHQ